MRNRSSVRTCKRCGGLHNAANSREIEDTICRSLICEECGHREYSIEFNVDIKQMSFPKLAKHYSHFDFEILKSQTEKEKAQSALKRAYFELHRAMEKVK